MENLENFDILVGAFGDLSQKGLKSSDWSCKFLQTIGYQTPKGLVVNNVCKNNAQNMPVVAASDFISLGEEEESTTGLNSMETTTKYDSLESSTSTNRSGIVNPEDLIESEETSTKPRESLEEDDSDTKSMFNVNIETLDETRTTLPPDTYTASVQEIFPTTESYEKTNEKGILKTVKNKVVGWKNKVVRKWNDWVG